MRRVMMRTGISEAVRLREQAFQRGEVRRVINSVLGNKKGAPGIATAETATGGILSSPQEVEAGLAKHFYEAFAGAEANVWYNAPGTPQLVS